MGQRGAVVYFLVLTQDHHAITVRPCHGQCMLPTSSSSFHAIGLTFSLVLQLSTIIEFRKLKTSFTVWIHSRRQRKFAAFIETMVLLSKNCLALLAHSKRGAPLPAT